MSNSSHLFLQVFFLSIRYSHGDSELSRQLVPELPAVSLMDLYHKASLVFKLTDFGFETTRPGMPDLVPLGHLVSRPAKPLVWNFDNILKKSKG